MLKFGIPALQSIINENIKSTDHYTLTNNNQCLINNFKDNIILNNISFAYQENNEKLIFKNLNLKIEKKKIIGIFGHSGSGKSTFVDILSGLLVPTSGSILIDGKNIGKNDKLLRSIFAYVPQTVYILDDTIKNNIVFGQNYNEIDIKRLNNAIQLSQLEYFVEKLANGIDTIVGERGAAISGGQIQRIGIARALYHKAEVLIFDESTNALDSNTENKIMEEIKQLKKIKTIIIVSHNIKILEICDEIYELKDKTLNIKI
jgi:ABC-type bacteriocin/lantibiotic exporter with double-glycine peptidase domain